MSDSESGDNSDDRAHPEAHDKQSRQEQEMVVTRPNMLDSQLQKSPEGRRRVHALSGYLGARAANLKTLAELCRSSSRSRPICLDLQLPLRRHVGRLRVGFASPSEQVGSTFSFVPNQLAKSKRRQSLAEHEAVLAVLMEIARRENTTVMALLRQAARALVRKKSDNPALAETLRQVAWQKAPIMPARFKTPAEVARFKRQQREFDQALLDMALASPHAIQQRNSVVPSRRAIRLIDFDQAHAAAV
jgi:hypothetical protein